jgi:hypothetical protein
MERIVCLGESLKFVSRLCLLSLHVALPPSAVFKLQLAFAQAFAFFQHLIRIEISYGVPNGEIRLDRSFASRHLKAST